MYPCPGCGGKLGYSAEKQKVACSYCGYAEDYSRANDRLVENPLDEAIIAAPKHVVEDIGKKVFDCQSCGSKFMVESDKVKVKCGFCGSQNVNIETGRGKHRKYLPYAFTKQGVAMLSAVLRSQTADFMLEFIESDIDNMVSQVVIPFKS